MWEDRRNLVFFHMCLVGRMKRWKDKKKKKKKNSFFWLRRKMQIENRVGINLPLCLII